MRLWGWQECHMASAGSGARPSSVASWTEQLTSDQSSYWEHLYILPVAIHQKLTEISVYVVVEELVNCQLCPWLRKHNNGKLSTCWQPKLWSQVSLLSASQFTKTGLTSMELMEEVWWKLSAIGRKISFCKDIVKPFSSNNIVKMRRK